MILINSLKLRPDHSDAALLDAVCKKLGADPKDRSFRDGLSVDIVKRSLDARDKKDIRYVYALHVDAPGEQQILRRKKRDRNIEVADPNVYELPDTGNNMLKFRPVIAGSGPSGLFCALALARKGFCPIILERGDDVDQRSEKTRRFWEKGILDLNSNVQFGEGGAGTFSDGKLNSSIKDKTGRIPWILREFVKAGASPETAYTSAPHVGSDVLVSVLKSIRSEIIRLGGEFRFRSLVTDISALKEGLLLTVADTSQQSDKYEHLKEGVSPRSLGRGASDYSASKELLTSVLVLATGHSARDTYAMLRDRGFELTPKAFAAGLRIQHPQLVIDRAMYGADCPYHLGAAPYKVSASLSEGNVYSFCMCPGGHVVNSSFEEGRTVINGMSYSGRDSGSANSALVVGIPVEEFYVSNDPLSGIRYQRIMEEKAFKAGNGRIPVQRLKDFLENRPSSGRINDWGCFKGEYVFANIRDVLTPRMNRCIEEGIEVFARRIEGFDMDEALLSAVETCTSSPVRITRDPDTCQAPGFPGVYPCGEGAGYAGGIVSAAADGLRVAEKIISNFCIDFIIE